MADDQQQDKGSQTPDDTNDAEVPEVPEEQPIEQQIVPFLGDELAAAMTANGAIYITFPGMCTALGLNARGQTQRVQRTRLLSHALRRIPLETRGGLQRINCLRVDKIALWLAGVQTNHIKLPFREKIEAYQDELAPVATQVFLRVLGMTSTQLVPASADPQVAALAEQIDALTGVVTFLREHMEAVLATTGQIAAITSRLDDAIALLESLVERQDTTETQVAKIDARTQRLTPAHTRTVQELVDRMVRETKHLAVPLTYATIYGRLKHRFRAGSYKEVPDERFDEIMAYLHDELSRATSGDAPEHGCRYFQVCTNAALHERG